jgi:hypothetical protein
MLRALRTKAFQAAMVLAAAYAMLLTAFLSAAEPSIPEISVTGAICLHDGGTPDQPVGPSSSHDDSCCVAICGIGIAALQPFDYSRARLLRADTLLAFEWSLAFVAPLPAPNAQASPRGPPSLI